MAAPPPLKIAFMGDLYSGCHSILSRKYYGRFPEYKPGVGDDVFGSTEDIDGEKVACETWRMPGSEDWQRIRTLTYSAKDTPPMELYVLVFSVVVPSSLDSIRTLYVPELTQYQAGIPYIIMGLKTDLRADAQTLAKLTERGLAPITNETGAAAARELGAVGYEECSALTEEGVGEAFRSVFRSAHQARKRREAEQKDGRTKCVLM